GRFDSFNGIIHYDRDRPERSRVQWHVELRSVETGEPNRDRALQSPQYFDTARHPQMSFVSRSVHRLPDQRLAIRGHLTIRGVTRPLTVYARITENGDHTAVAETRFSIDRLEYGVVGGTTLRRAISRMVEVRIVAAGTNVGNGGR
ncbi:MAG TPA: YceI family protein, partial [Thermoanaerobaculia bacterium]|nr:YceI family protein [Thermoanaerobaculia bacterium]